MSETTLTPILVTGAHRSGTTWVGKMLAADGCTAYISEPLNVLHRPGVFHAKVKHWYQYICEENEGEYLPAFQELLEFDYHLWDEIRSLRSRKDFLRMGRDFLIFYNGLMRGQRALLEQRIEGLGAEHAGLWEPEPTLRLLHVLGADPQLERAVPPAVPDGREQRRPVRTKRREHGDDHADRRPQHGGGVVGAAIADQDVAGVLRQKMPGERADDRQHDPEQQVAEQGHARSPWTPHRSVCCVGTVLMC